MEKISHFNFTSHFKLNVKIKTTANETKFRGLSHFLSTQKKLFQVRGKTIGNPQFKSILFKNKYENENNHFSHVSNEGDALQRENVTLYRVTGVVRFRGEFTKSPPAAIGQYVSKL